MSTRTHRPLNEQVVVITGASSGIGLATARAAAQAGARLVLAARSLETLEAIAAELRTTANCDAWPIGADVAEPAEVRRIAELALQRFGRIDTWVNDAGLSIYGRIEQVDLADARRLFDVNFWGVVHGSQAALPHLRASGGVLINVGSEVSDATLPLQGLYAASKHAVKGYTDALRIEVELLDKAPVSIVLIQPTAVDTPFPQHARNYMDREPKLPTPMIEPERVAEAILKAAVEGGRDIRVGAMATLNVMSSRLMPAVADRMAAKQADRQQEDIPPINAEGTLYRPGHSGRAHGEPRHVGR